uniref:helix-turn-helix domain-containing protein n=1 Tax=Corynebacterium casei TaxID=160386 RepID=UPI000BF078BB|nr:helix-turn-helix transcriptional regulator [Corynebacterium casei]
MEQTEDFHPASTYAAQNVARLRKDHGWSRQEFTRRLKQEGIIMHPTALQRIEHEGQRLRLDEAVAIAAIFGTALDELVASADPSAQADQAADAAVQRGRKIGDRLFGIQSELQEIESNLRSHQKTARVREVLNWLDKAIDKIFPATERLLDGPSHDERIAQQSRQHRHLAPSPDPERSTRPHQQALPEPSTPRKPQEKAIELGTIGPDDEKLFTGESVPLRPELHVQREAEEWWGRNGEDSASAER